MAFSIGNQYQFSNLFIGGSLTTDVGNAGVSGWTGELDQMNDGKTQYYNINKSPGYNNREIVMADSSDIIHLSGGGWNPGTYTTTDVSGGVGTVGGILYKNDNGDQVLVTGGAKVDTSDENAQSNKDALKADIDTIENDPTVFANAGSKTDGLVSAQEIQQAIDDHKFDSSPDKKNFWQGIVNVFTSFDNTKAGAADGVINVQDLVANGGVDQA
jgi:hypothetical protein